MNAAFREALDEHTGPVLRALAKSAQCLGKEGHADRKLFLQLIGFTADGAQDANDGQGSSKDVDSLSDAELVGLFEGREHLLPPGVQRRLGMDPEASSAQRARMGLNSPNERTPDPAA